MLPCPFPFPLTYIGVDGAVPNTPVPGVGGALPPAPAAYMGAYGLGGPYPAVCGVCGPLALALANDAAYGLLCAGGRSPSPAKSAGENPGENGFSASCASALGPSPTGAEAAPGERFEWASARDCGRP